MTRLAEARDLAADAAAPATGIRVAVLGRLDGFSAPPTAAPDVEVSEFEAVEDVVRARPDVVHLVGRGSDPRELKQRLPDSKVVVDLSGTEEIGLGWLEARRIRRSADLIVLGSEAARERFSHERPGLAPLARAVVPPLDLEWHAPLEAIGRVPARDRVLKRFRRIHRLVDAAVLFVGPYTPDGGLDVVLDAVFELRERFPGLRLAAVPYGSVDTRFLAACERRALALGHHGIIEWHSERSDLPLWHALATVVCSPGSRGAAALPARLAAAAARPFVGTRGGSAEGVVVDSETGFLVPPGDPAALTEVLGRLIDDTDEADRLGREARRRIEESDRGSTAAWIEQVWSRAGAKPAAVIEHDVR